MDSVAQLFMPGTTYYGSTPFRSVPDGSAASPYGTSVALEGKTKEFRDVDPVAHVAGGIDILRSDRMVLRRAVRNVSGIALQPCMAVTWAAGYRGLRVDAYANPAAIGGENVAGIVDDWLPEATGLPDNDIGYIVVRGPCYVRTPVAGTAYSAGADLYAASAASSQEEFLASSTATSSAEDDEGRVVALVATYSATEQADGTVIDVAHNRVAVAMEAATAGELAARKLVDVCIR